MPVTKTAKRALRSSKEKKEINTLILSGLEKAIRTAKKSKKRADILKVVSLADRASKKHTIHKNKAARIKSAISKLAPISATKKSASKTEKSKPKPKK